MLTRPRPWFFAPLALLAAFALVFLAARAAAGRLAGFTSAGPNCGGSQAAAPTGQPADSAGYLAQGDALYDQGNCAGAIAAYTRAVELDPESAEAYNNRAYTYMAQGDYARALPDLDIALELRPDYVNALMNRGDLHNYYYDIDYAKAIADYDRVLALPHDRTSVCGHRLLAQHHGWDLGVLAAVALQGVNVGCN